MSTQLKLIYPDHPGSKRSGTSKESSEKIAAVSKTLRDQCLEWLQTGGEFTADEIAELLHKTEFSIRPRITELCKKGLIVDSGRRRKNRSGHNAIVWKMI